MQSGKDVSVISINTTPPYPADTFGAAVIGAGHAGVEAALALARLGIDTVLFTLSLDQIANMPCNPSIGGTAKGHLVREIDALGGEMGRAADAVTIHSRMLNRGKGPAVHSLRAQTDRKEYHRYMKELLEHTQNLTIKQAEISRLIITDGRITGVVTHLGAVYTVRACVLACGTYLKGKIFIGEYTKESGPDNSHPAEWLSESLREAGISLRRFKTGTPARVDRRTIDIDCLEVQPGDEPPEPFSFMTDEPIKNREHCYIAYTNADTHRIILDNLHRSPLYKGEIEGVGPRYCPSIEDKVKRFADKERHQLFIEPMGINTNEMYLQGMSSSLPEEVQLEFYRSIKGFSRLELMRTAYAIEYDCIYATDLLPTLEFKAVSGLFCAGQLNGTSGYEEAAAQGLVAGINAARGLKGETPAILSRTDSYIGTLIDDIVTKGVDDPYRMMTSRSEYRLYLRQDNADERLTPKGYEWGLVSSERWERYNRIKDEKERLIRFLCETTVQPDERVNSILTEKGTTPITSGIKAAELLKRPQLDLAAVRSILNEDLPAVCALAAGKAEIELKYEGYVKKQRQEAERQKRLEDIPLSPDTDYTHVDGLRLEAREKLNRVRPMSVAGAARIPGVTPADVAVLLMRFR